MATVTAATPPGLRLEPLAAFLAEPLGLDPALPLEAELIEGGRSNITCLLRQGERSWVLRRPPLGHRQPTAHSMRREHDVLAGLAGSEVPAPRPLALCEDEAVIGAEFYVMERVEGRILRAPADVDLSPAEARACGLALIETLAAQHRADYERLGLGGLGRPAGFAARQVKRWTGQLESGIRVTPAMRELGRRLEAAVPAREEAALVHGDYRIDNVVLDPADPGRVAAVLDWEMATLGDPLADLGMLLMYWRRPGERCASEVHAITQAEGFPERGELIDAYAAATGFDLDGLEFFLALAHFKLAVIVAGIRARMEAGETVGGGFEQIAEIPEALVAEGLEVEL
ncbi:MAG TPA: phosphotransferase family protein [Solirubrobacterales bacterium]|nr:phosphotransferase family protein [Solirubrobacterales bacterium]